MLGTVLITFASADGHADTLVAVNKTATAQGECESYSITVTDPSPPDKTGLKSSTLTSVDVATPWTKYDAYPDAEKDPASADVFVRLSSAFHRIFKTLTLTGGSGAAEHLSNPGMISYYFCDGVGVLKFGTGKSFADRADTISLELRGSVGKLLTKCAPSSSPRLVICPTIATKPSNAVIELSWRRTFTTANALVDTEGQDQLSSTPDPPLAYAQALLGITGINPAGSISDAVAAAKALCKYGQTAFDLDSKSSEPTRTDNAKFRTSFQDLCHDLATHLQF